MKASESKTELPSIAMCSTNKHSLQAELHLIQHAWQAPLAKSTALHHTINGHKRVSTSTKEANIMSRIREQSSNCNDEPAVWISRDVTVGFLLYRARVAVSVAIFSKISAAALAKNISSAPHCYVCALSL